MASVPGAGSERVRGQPAPLPSDGASVTVRWLGGGSCADIGRAPFSEGRRKTATPYTEGRARDFCLLPSAFSVSLRAGECYAATPGDAGGPFAPAGREAWAWRRGSLGPGYAWRCGRSSG